MQFYARFLLRFRVPMTALGMALLLASLASLPHVKLDLSIIPILEANQAAVERVEDFRQTFPVESVDLTCVVEWPFEVGPEELGTARELGEAFRELDVVSNVRSLATTQIVEVGPGGVPRAVDFAATVGAEGVLAKAQQHPLLKNRLISRDGRSLPLLISIDLPLADPGREQALEDLREVASRELVKPVQVRFLGGEVVEQTMSRTIRWDMAQSVALESIFFLIFLPIIFRTFRGMLLPLIAINSALVLNFGAMVVLDLAISSLGVAIPGLIVIIGLSDAIHMMYRFEEAFARHGAKDRAIVEMMEHVGLACFYTSFTTALGFLSLLAAGHSAVREFAWIATLGVVVAFVTVVTFLPLLLSFWPVRHAGRSAQAIVRLGYGRRGVTLAVFSAGLVLALWGMRNIVVDADWLGELPDDNAVVQDFKWYEENFEGLLSLEVWLEGPLEDPRIFRQIEALETAMLEKDGITSAESYVDWVRELLGNAESPDEATIQRGIGFLRASGEAFPRHVITPDLEEGRIAFQTRDLGIRRFLEISDQMLELTKETAPDVSARVAGYSRMAYESSEMVVRTLLSSLALSMASIGFFIALSYRSLRLGLIATVLNAIPIVAALGLTGMLGMKLRIGIVMVYCLGIGLAVDDTIHMLTRYLHERRVHSGRTVQVALNHTLRTTGVALLTTSIILTMGAVSYLPSAFQSISEVGILLSCIVIVALLADLFLLPILVERFAPDAGKPKSAAAVGRK